MLKVTLLGTGGMMPLKTRALASAMPSSEGRACSIDCGERHEDRFANAALRLSLSTGCSSP